MHPRSSRRRWQNLHKGEAIRGTFFHRKKKKKTAPASSFERVFERVFLAARLSAQKFKRKRVRKGLFDQRQTNKKYRRVRLAE
jgi:hypothetical protein